MDEETVRHVMQLARLQLSDAEIARFAGDLSSITDYIAQLSKVDVDGVPATVHPVADRNLWREDEVAPGFKRELATGNAPESEQNFFKVPPAIDTE
ncbi:MAG: Asp-tRNA(Asn)/Glu-tRNA(Gln) amidotransferase subunit GatC [Planctomycetes bacterium]|nr:Asp-tRNA(Asn)/Glu-tRNA(Gln) amidotransferase subunit GatC [Planctomycetota bacterium]